MDNQQYVQTVSCRVFGMDQGVENIPNMKLYFGRLSSLPISEDSKPDDINDDIRMFMMKKNPNSTIDIFIADNICVIKKDRISKQFCIWSWPDTDNIMFPINIDYKEFDNTIICNYTQRLELQSNTEPTLKELISDYVLIEVDMFKMINSGVNLDTMFSLMSDISQSSLSNINLEVRLKIRFISKYLLYSKSERKYYIINDIGSSLIDYSDSELPMLAAPINRVESYDTNTCNNKPESGRLNGRTMTDNLICYYIEDNNIKCVSKYDVIKDYYNRRFIPMIHHHTIAELGRKFNKDAVNDLVKILSIIFPLGK